MILEAFESKSLEKPSLSVNSELLEVYRKRKVLDRCNSKAFFTDI